MRVLIANKFEPSGIEGLRALGGDITYDPDAGDRLASMMTELAPDVLIVRATKVTADALVPSLKLIVRAGAGVNTIDVASALARGIIVTNCPGINAIAVAELAFGLMLAVDRRIPDNVSDLRAGVWNKKEYSRARGLFGRTLGLLGAGAIGREMIRRAAGFGMPVVLWSRRFNGRDGALSAVEGRELGVEAARSQIPVTLAPTPRAAAERSDVLSVHVALTPETKHLVNADVLAGLRSGGILINTARGDLVDAQALAAAVKDRGIRAGLDVFAAEPPASAGPFVDPIVQMPGVYGTHHIGASTDQAQEAIAAETVQIVKSFMETGRVPAANAVSEP